MKKHTLFALLLTVLPFLTTVGAETACPWINKATVSGILGSTVSLKMRSADGNGDVCFFHSQSKDSIRSLRVIVRDRDDGHQAMSYESQCSSDRDLLKGIGNDAILCGIADTSLLGVEIGGRVRNRTFEIRLENNRRKNPGMTEKMLWEKAATAAEQVAGNLF